MCSAHGPKPMRQVRAADCSGLSVRASSESASLSIVVAIEKMAPHGQKLAWLLGLGLIGAGLVKLLAATA
jgi:hypothetical protein